MDMLLYLVAIIGGTYQYDKPTFFAFVAFLVVVATVFLYLTRSKKPKRA